MASDTFGIGDLFRKLNEAVKVLGANEFPWHPVAMLRANTQALAVKVVQ